MSSTMTGNDSGNSGGSRSGRLPRWTRQEILVLVEAKQAYEKQCRSGLGRPSEPKWVFVSSRCRREGMERGPLQCRKRWSNLACDFKKIKAWEGKMMSESRESERNVFSLSYWMMRSEMRRERRLPGFFDREVFEMMDGDQVVEVEVKEEEEEEVVFDSRRTAREDGLFLEFEEEDEEEGAEENEEMLAAAGMTEPIVVVPISERKYQPENEHSDPGNSNDNKQQPDNNPEKGSTSWEGQKRRRTSEATAGAGAGAGAAAAAAEETRLENKLIEVLETNSRILSAHLEAQNLNCQLDRDQRKDQTDGLLAVMTKLADALGRIADKL